MIQPQMHPDALRAAIAGRLPENEPAPPADGRARRRKAEPEPPAVFQAAEVLKLKVEEPTMLIEDLLPDAGACLLFGGAKAGKTLLGMQAAIAVSTGRPLFDCYRIRQAGAAMVVEQDDPAGAAVLKTVLKRAGVCPDGLCFVPEVPFPFGAAFTAWLENEIVKRGLRLVILDSYTSLRGPRGAGCDIVKAEQRDLTELDSLGKRLICCIVVIHHTSKGAAGLDWHERAAGTFAFAAATQAQLHLSRFSELASDSPDRLLRVRGRQQAGREMVLRFRPDRLDYEHVLAGPAAPLWPVIAEIAAHFKTGDFTPKELTHATGLSRRTVHRYVADLFRAGAVIKHGFGSYRLAPEVASWQTWQG